MTIKWVMRYLHLAEMVASWSKDPSTQCGAVVVRPDKTLASVGYNGFPRGCKDDDEIYANRDLKLARVIHAEQNALLNAGGQDLTGCTMYTWPPGFGPSCDRCSAHIIQAGIVEVVHVYDDSDFASRWKEPAQRGLDMYEEAGVVVRPISFSQSEEYTGSAAPTLG
jgi:dCMP deaminase